MTPRPTLINTVNTWECDENDHLNVQGYVARFDEADTALRLDLGLDSGRDPAANPRRMRIVRYHSELRPGEPVAVRSALCRGVGPWQGVVQHLLGACDDGRLSATALDLHDRALGVAESPVAPEALPRSTSLSLHEPIGFEEILARRGARITYRASIMPGEVMPDGTLLDRAIIARFSDAAPHAWGEAGLTNGWLKHSHQGRVAVEVRLSYGAAPRIGDNVAIASNVIACAAKTVTFRHVLHNLTRDEVIATGDITSLSISYDNRRAVAWPDDKLAEIKTWLAAFEAGA